MVGAWRRPPACRGRLRGAPPRGRRSRNAGGLNLYAYAYAENDPLNRSDFLGLATLQPTVRKTVTVGFFALAPISSTEVYVDTESGRVFKIRVRSFASIFVTRTFDVVQSGDPVDFVDPEGREFPGKDQEPTPGDDVLEEALAEEDEPFRTAADTRNVGEDVGISEDEIDLPLLIDIALVAADAVSIGLTVADIIVAGPTGEGIILAAGVQAGKAKLKKAAIKKAAKNAKTQIQQLEKYLEEIALEPPKAYLKEKR